MATTERRMGGYQPPASVHNRAAAEFGAMLEASLGDKVAFHHTGNVIAEGRKAADLLDLVASGELTMCYFAASYLSDLVPELALFDLPFVIADRQAAYAALDGPISTMLQERMLAASNYRILGFWDNGFRHLTNRVRPIRRPADCVGLSIRTLFS
ncbi:MAG: TRAP transporter substrate-binding protein DctP, partial [Alphaproteobacteria bacterium]